MITESRRRQPADAASHMPSRSAVSVEIIRSGEKWRKISWRRGSKGRPTCLLAVRRVRMAEGHKHQMLDDRMRCMPGGEVWLVGERRSTGEQKYFVSNLAADATLEALAAAIKTRLICKQAHHHLKEELALDHLRVSPGPAYIDTP